MISCVAAVVRVIQQGTCAGVLVPRAEVGHDGSRLVAGLGRHDRVVDAATVDARRRARLQASDAQGHGPQPLGQGVGGGIAGAAALMLLEADVDAAAQEGAGGEHHGARPEHEAHLRDDAAHAIALDHQVRHGLLEDLEIRLVLDDLADGGAIEGAVRLGARGAHGRPLAGVQHPELDAGLVRRAAHGPAERIDLLDQMRLADAADGGIAGHLADGLDAHGEQQRARTGARRGERCLGAGVTAADHDDVVAVGMFHGWAGTGRGGPRSIRMGGDRGQVARLERGSVPIGQVEVAGRCRRDGLVPPRGEIEGETSTNPSCGDRYAMVHAGLPASVRQRLRLPWRRSQRGWQQTREPQQAQTASPPQFRSRHAAGIARAGVPVSRRCLEAARERRATIRQDAGGIRKSPGRLRRPQSSGAPGFALGRSARSETSAATGGCRRYRLLMP